ncbi:MAG: hypothetical protein Q4C42_01570 [Clostridia bacterium]|nr:hypothetical protein [Clostridia bacterium]
MFTISNVTRNVLRNKGKSLIALIVVMVLSAFLVIYSGFLGKQEQELKDISENINLELKFCNISGTQTTGLIIDTRRLDIIANSGYCTPIVYVTGGLYSDELISKVRVRNKVATTLGACAGTTNDSLFEEGEITYLNGYDGSLFSGEDFVCVMSEDMLEKSGLKVGDEFTKFFYTKRENGGSFFSGEHTFKIVGSFDYIDNDRIPMGVGFIAPFQTLRNMAEEQNFHTWPTSANFRINNPEDLNDLIALLKDTRMVECQRKTSSTAQYGNSCIITDGIYIRTSEPLIKNINMLNTLYYPIFIAAVLIAFLSSYLLMQSRRGEIAINCSLGSSKLNIFGTMMLESAFICIVGAVVSAAVCLIVSAEPISTAYSVLVFIPVYLFGCALAVLTLLRTNVISILTSSD